MNRNTPGLGVIVLAAGRGTRMKSSLPKVLHTVCGLPMAAHVLEAARAVSPVKTAVVVGYGAEQVRGALGDGPAYVVQEQLLGTGDAVQRCREAMAGVDRVVVLNGDAPLLTGAAVQSLVETTAGATMGIAVNRVKDEGAFGRVRRDSEGRVCEIVEAESDEGGEVERNAGFYAFDAAWLWENISRVETSAKGERYLTDLAAMAYGQSEPVETAEMDVDEAMGVDDRVRLAEAEGIMRRRLLEQLMRDGVTVRDPATTYIDATVAIGEDATIEPGSHLRGASSVGRDTVIGPNTILVNSRVGERCLVRQSTLEDSSVGNDVEMGPHAHLRGGADIGDRCELGNYAEVKNSRVGEGVKIHHFSYLGDADVGANVNYAAGAVTCNYDGVAKHRTVIGAGAFIGCDTMLVAPVTIGEGAITGAGSVITHDVAPGETVAGVPARPLPTRAGRE